jgi:hypothetical protein
MRCVPMASFGSSLDFRQPGSYYFPVYRCPPDSLLGSVSRRVNLLYLIQPYATTHHVLPRVRRLPPHKF